MEGTIWSVQSYKKTPIINLSQLYDTCISAWHSRRRGLQLIIRQWFLSQMERIAVNTMSCMIWTMRASSLHHFWLKLYPLNTISFPSSQWELSVIWAPQSAPVDLIPWIIFLLDLSNARLRCSRSSLSLWGVGHIFDTDHLTFAFWPLKHYYVAFEEKQEPNKDKRYKGEYSHLRYILILLIMLWLWGVIRNKPHITWTYNGFTYIVVCLGETTAFLELESRHATHELKKIFPKWSEPFHPPHPTHNDQQVYRWCLW